MAREDTIVARHLVVLAHREPVPEWRVKVRVRVRGSPIESQYPSGHGKALGYEGGGALDCEGDEALGDEGGEALRWVMRICGGPLGYPMRPRGGERRLRAARLLSGWWQGWWLA